MTIIYRQYDSTDRAESAITALQTAGVAVENLSLIMGTPVRDAHAERVGSFAAGDGHDHDAHAEHAGTFAEGDGHDHDAHAEPTGSFAGGDSHAGRVGSFADVDREIVTTFRAGKHEATTSSHQQIMSMLVEAGLDQAGAKAQLEAIHAGKALVLVQAASADAERVQTLLATM